MPPESAELRAVAAEQRVTELTDALGDCWGALNFILAFYEPGQRYLDTNAWKEAEASGRRAHARAAELLRGDRPAPVDAKNLPENSDV